MRIAWIGPMPGRGGGASGVSTLLLSELGCSGVQIDCYVSGSLDDVPEGLRTIENLKFICMSSGWEWNKWYSRNNLLAFITGQIANLRIEDRLADEILRQHRIVGYDVIYQFSHIEMSKLRKYKSKLPPIVLHPSVHAAGELKWLRRESDLHVRSQFFFAKYGARLLMQVRAKYQRRHIQIPDLILALSNHFYLDLANDYNVPKERFRHVPNPINLVRFVPTDTPRNAKIIILFVSRISVRKGVDMVVQLSHKLDDLKDKIQIRVVGEHSLWSDYRSLLQGLNPGTAVYVGGVKGEEGGMVSVFQQADILVQPSKYEPFGLTVGEALACGLPVVASDKVGAAEDVDPACCRIFPNEDMTKFEHEVRQLVQEIGDPRKRAEIRRRARAEAERVFGSRIVAKSLIDALHHATKISPMECNDEYRLNGNDREVILDH